MTGRYQLQITPSASCGAPRPAFTFPMDAATAGAQQHAGTQVVLTGDPGALEAELISENQALRGTIGTTHDGVTSSEAFQLWVNVTAAAQVVRASDGRGEVRTGTLMGTLSFGRPGDDEGELGTCVARDHSFTLAAR